MQRTSGRIALLPRRREHGQLVGEAQPDATVAGTECPGTDPHHLAGGAQLVEQRWPVGTHAGGQDVGLDRRGDQGRAREDPERLDERFETAPVGRDVLPRRQEAGERRLVDRLDLAPQSRQRTAAQLAQHVDIAVLAGQRRRGGTHRARCDRRPRGRRSRPPSVRWCTRTGGPRRTRGTARGCGRTGPPAPRAAGRPDR